MKSTRAIDLKLGQNIVKHRVESGLSRKDLAEAVGITHQQMQKYEHGINRISVSRLFDVAKVLKLPVIRLLDVEADHSTYLESKESKFILDIMKYINKIKDETKLVAIKNLVRSLSMDDAGTRSW